MSGQRQLRISERFSTTTVFVGAVLLIALVARVTAVVVWDDGFGEDRDGYMGIAENLVAGNGYSHPKLGSPTAYRPPLYPLVLAAVVYCGGGTAAIGVLHVILGTATVFLTFLLARRLGLNRGAVVAAGLVAVDPILLRYTAYTMTETLFTFLVTLFLVLSLAPAPEFTVALRSRLWLLMRAMLIGVVFGLCALCRPTIWAFGGLACLAWLWRRWKNLEERAAFLFYERTFLMVAGVTLAVSPWLMRNLHVFERPIVTTTHGGYTLLLGNNPVFYDDVVRRPFGTVWERDSHVSWLYDVFFSVRPLDDEVALDRWMYDRAIANIKADPSSFLRACWLRFRRFWNVVPLNADGETRSPFAIWSVGLFYSAMLIGLVVSLYRMRNSANAGWVTLLLLIAAFTFVHLFYWSNARMRAPLIPAIAVIAAACFERRRP